MKRRITVMTGIAMSISIMMSSVCEFMIMNIGCEKAQTVELEEIVEAPDISTDFVETTELTSETVETTVPIETSTEYSETTIVEFYSDCYLLAYTMSREAAYGDWVDASYVGNVVLNRVDDPDFPNTVLEVLQQEGQYPWGVDVYSRAYIYDDKLYEIANELLEGNRKLPANVVYQSQYSTLGSGVYLQRGKQFYCIK